MTSSEPEEVLALYLRALDSRDWKTVRACFTAHAHADYSVWDEILVGRVEIAKRLQSAIERFDATTHLLAGVELQIVQNGGVRATSRVVAHLALGGTGGGRVIVRGLRYDDHLVVDAGGFRIRSRSQLCEWQFTALAESPAMF